MIVPGYPVSSMYICKYIIKSKGKSSELLSQQNELHTGEKRVRQKDFFKL